MSLNRLRWATIVGPIAFIICAELATTAFLERSLGLLAAHVVEMALIASAVVIFSVAVFRALERMQRRVVRQNEELSALNAVGQAVSGSQGLPEAVTTALEHVMAITGAAAGEIVIDGYEAGDRPLRLTLGSADLFEHAPDPTGGSSSAAGAGEASDVRIVDIPPVHTNGPPAGVRVSTSVEVPLVARDRRLGSMRLLAGDRAGLESGRSKPLLAAMGSQIAIAIQAGHLFDDVVQRSQETTALYEIGLKIASLQDAQQILDSVVQHAREVLRAEIAALCLSVEGNADLTVAGSAGPRDAFLRPPIGLPPLPWPSDAPMASTVGERRRGQCPVLAPGYRASALSAPLRIGGVVIGDLCVSNRERRLFTARDRELLQALADMAAIAINNARLLESERQVAVLEERERLSREMHDSLAQVLGYLHLKSEATRRALARNDVAAAESEVGDMALIAQEAYQDVREAILGLRETVSSDRGLIASLREYAQKFSRQSGVATELQVDAGETPRLPPEIEIQLIRVIQESLTNVRKHARAPRALIRVAHDSEGTVISIEDDGCGFEPARLEASGHHFGVRTMRERMERVGGRFEIDSSPGSGTRVRISFASADGGLHGAGTDPAGRRPAPLQEGAPRPS